MTANGMPITPLRVGLGTLAYTLATFVWAVVWHVGFFQAQYEAWGYIDADPNFALGLLSIVLQGAILSWLYPQVHFAGPAMMRGLKFAAVVGGFYWTCHVLAFAAKEDAANAPLFFLLETAYLAVQFSVFGLIISRVYQGAKGS